MSQEQSAAALSQEPPEISFGGRVLVLVTAFLGWMFAGTIMVLIPLAGRSAAISFLGPGHEAEVGNWFSRYICAFLLGAATGGLLFGWLGDRIGRAKYPDSRGPISALGMGQSPHKTQVRQRHLAGPVSCQRDTHVRTAKLDVGVGDGSQLQLVVSAG